MKAFIRTSARLLALLLIGLVLSIIYLDIHGFPPFLKEFVENQVHRQGLTARFSAIRLDVLRGVIAKDAVLSDAKAPEQVLAHIDELQIEWNWPRLFRRQNAINALQIANAKITVPTPPDEIGTQVFTATEAYATLVFEDDGSIQIDRLTGVYCGIRLQMSGRLKPRSATGGEQPTAKKPAPSQSQFVFVTKALRELNSLSGPQPPQLDVNFDLDLGAPLDSRVTAKLLASEVVYRKIDIQQLAVDVEMRGGGIDIRQCLLKVDKGELSIHGRYDVAAGGFDLQLNSSLDPNRFLPALPPEVSDRLRELRLLEPPKISVRYVLSPETGVLPVMQGRVEFGALEVRGVAFRAIAFSFEYQGADLKITDALIVTREGRLTGHGQYQIETSDFTYELDSTLDPRRLLPLMWRGQREIVEPSWFETPPHIVATVRGDFVDPEAFAYDATLITKRCSYRGVALNAVAAKLQLRRNRLDVRDLVVRRNEGNVKGSLLADFDRQQVTFDLQSTANPTEMAPLLGPRAAEIMAAYRFGRRTTATAHGMVDLTVPSNSCWQAHVLNEGLAYWKLVADKAETDLVISNDVLRLDNFKADVYGGELEGLAEFVLHAPFAYQFLFRCERSDFRKVMSAIRGKETDVSGVLTGEAKLTGLGSDLGTLRGSGKLSIAEGVFWEAPLFGIFSRILDGIGTGLGTVKATKADASFAIEDKWAKTDDLKVAAGVFTLTSHGKVNFNGKLDFLVKGQLLKNVPGINILTWFFSNIFEYKIGGTLSDYNYRPVNLPKEIMPHDDSSKDNPTSKDKRE